LFYLKFGGVAVGQFSLKLLEQMPMAEGSLSLKQIPLEKKLEEKS
jgi:hypothetical protein